MKKGTGIPVFPGIALGIPFFLPSGGEGGISAAGSPESEKNRLAAALETVREQLSGLYEKAREELGEAQAAVVEVQLLLLEDPEFLEAITGSIETGLAAAAAVAEAGEAFARIFSAMEDAYLQARGGDIRDLCHRIRDVLLERRPVVFPKGPFLLVADDLSPSQTLSLPRDRVLGFVTRQGSPLSHTAILAKTWGLPSLVQAEVPLCQVLAIDSVSGHWYADPDGETLAGLRQRRAEMAQEAAGLAYFRKANTQTRSGKRLELMANIGSPEDAELAKAAGAEGIGLLRSEFLYLGRETLPTEEVLFSAYRRIAQTMGQLPVLIRTLDLGADKQTPCLPLAPEENPALGLRGIRLCLEQQALFRTQLRAIYRASVFGDLHILFPMIASLWELRAAKEICGQVRRELGDIPHREIPLGIMIETPAAAILAEDFAKEVDFFSVGTNDLTQYTLAADRQISRHYDPRHPAIPALLAHIAQTAQKAGIWAGVCGELAADPEFQESLIRMGYRELSMAPGSIPEARKRISQFDI